MADLYIWVNRWSDFQTYQVKRGKPWAPPWVRDLTRQLDDDRYLSLTAAERGLLHDIRLAFARTRLDLSTNTSRLSQRFGYRVYTKQLESLNHAGFIDFCSGTVLEHRRNAFWNGSTLEVEVEQEHKPKAVSERTNGHHPHLVENPAGDPDADIDFNGPAIPRRTA